MYCEEAYRVLDAETIADILDTLPVFGDFAGAYGVDLDDALAGLAVFSGSSGSPKPVSGISPPPRRDMGEVIYVLQRLSGVER